MIDVETEVYGRCAQALRAAIPGVLVSGDYVRAPSRFPFVSIVEVDNYMTRAHLDSGEAERYATLTYEVAVYSDRAAGRKSECRRILAVVDEVLYRLGARRLSMTPVPNLEDATIYRLVARYRVETDGTYLYRR